MTDEQKKTLRDVFYELKDVQAKLSDLSDEVGDTFGNLTAEEQKLDNNKNLRLCEGALWEASTKVDDAVSDLEKLNPDANTNR